MTEPFRRPPDSNDSPTTQTQQASYDSVPETPTPPRGPQQAPPAWQPAGSSGANETDAMTWTPVGQQPVAQSRGRGRWLIALLTALVLVVGVVGISVFALGSKANASVGPGFLPATTPLYAEIRLDLPGSQRDNVVKFLSHFPGFADPSAFDAKIDQTLDKYITGATSGAATYTGNIKPWFGGQVAIGLLEMPSTLPGSLMPGASGGSVGSVSGVLRNAATAHLVAGISIKDRSRLDTLLTTLRAAASGETFDQQQYNDHTIVTVSNSGTAVAAYSLSDTLFLVATNASDLQKSLDVLDGKTPSLAADSSFVDAMKSLPVDRLGAFYGGPAVFQASAAAMNQAQNGSGAVVPSNTLAALQCLQPTLTDASSARAAAAIVANGDSISIESRGTNIINLPARTATDLAAHAPADAVAYVEVPKVGGSLHDIVACLRTAMPDAFTGQQVKQVEQLLGTKLEDYLSFVGDAGISVTYDGTKFHWGLVSNVDNEETAKSRVNSLVSFAKLAAGMGQAPVTVVDQQVNGTTVSTIRVTDSSMIGGAPIDASVSVAVAAGHLYIGDGAFAGAAIARSSADSLASNSRYSSALTAAGNPSGMLVYVDVEAVRQRIETSMSANQDYTTNTQPYLKPFDRVLLSASQDGNVSAGHVLLFVK